MPSSATSNPIMEFARISVIRYWSTRTENTVSITLRFCWIHFSHASDEQCFWFFRDGVQSAIWYSSYSLFCNSRLMKSFVPEVIGMRNLSHHAFSGDTIMAGCFRHHIAHGQPLIGHLKVQLQPIVPLLF